MMTDLEFKKTYQAMEAQFGRKPRMSVLTDEERQSAVLTIEILDEEREACDSREKFESMIDAKWEGARDGLLFSAGYLPTEMASGEE